MNLFARARANLNLTPAERALLRLVDFCVIAGLVAALPVVADALGHQAVDWASVGRMALAAFAVAAIGTLLKWLRAQAQAPLPETTAPAAGGQPTTGATSGA